jgi:undecaprenyl pyrophosphate phosphatase UppP
MFAILVALMIGILVGFVVAWVVVPSFREWIERPKYTMLERERRFVEDDEATKSRREP